VEALLRWRHPERGLVAPGAFIPLAEETGLIVPIGAWVLREACRQGIAWRRAGAPDFRMAVNISSRQFWRGNLLETLEQVLHDCGAPASLLEIELTESILVRHEAETVDLLKHLSMLGVMISIDDFGTGYSSLSYLKRFPIHKLKIDQSFVRDIHEDVDDAAITTAIIAMARGLNLKVIAEGVETRAQLEFLNSLGCHEAQGYHLGRPVPAADLDAIAISGRLWDVECVVL
jgi:EAL domain-containing protein (putative c-di-GMP-specific phosphodiesterase class I)